jgi:hypothetical protein
MKIFYVLRIIDIVLSSIFLFVTFICNFQITGYVFGPRHSYEYPPLYIYPPPPLPTQLAPQLPSNSSYFTSHYGSNEESTDFYSKLTSNVTVKSLAKYVPRLLVCFFLFSIILNCFCFFITNKIIKKYKDYVNNEQIEMFV